MEAVRSVKQVDLSKTVLFQPLSSNAFVTHLNAAREAIIPDRVNGSRIKYNDLSAAIRQFESFQTEKRLEPIVPDEGLIADFFQTLLRQNGNQCLKHCQAMTNNVRRLINHFPNEMLQRQLLNTKEFKRANRVHILEPKTQAILNEFVNDGRITKGGIFSIKRLSPNSRQKMPCLATRFLTIVEKKSLFAVTQNEVETFIEFYEDQGKRLLALNYLVDLRSLFANMVGRKYISVNPLEEYRRKINKDDDDFIMPDQMGKIQDLTTLNFKDKWAVRDRMITFVLYYDFCLRCNEAVLLKITDIYIEKDMVAINLRGEIQKGQNKKDIMLYSYFPAESKRLIEAYLKFRNEMNPKTDAFLVNQDGNPLMEGGCRDAVRTCCEILDVRTYKGEKPYPHCYRHTFATTNICSLGLQLDPYLIQRRLRHTDLATTTRVYVNHNPLLLKLEHMATLNRNRQQGQNHMGIIEKQVSFQAVANPNDISLPESDAILAVKPLGISWMSLRDYALRNQLAINQERQYLYSRSFVHDLTQIYMTKQQVMKQFKLAKGSFFFWKKSKGIEPLVIGRISLVRKDDLFREMKKCSKN